MKAVDAGRDIRIIVLSGDVSSSMEQEIHQLLIIEGKGTVILDFRSATSMDNTALSMLVRLHNSIRYTGQRLVAAGLSGRMLDAFRLARLDEGIPCFVDITAALQNAGCSDPPPQDLNGPSPTATETRDDPWASPISRLQVKAMPNEAVNLNVKGRRVAGPMQGFGQLWQKTYRISLPGEIEPAHAITVLKDNFTKFQPPANRFYPPPGGIRPGEVILINADTPGGQVATGVMVLYATSDSFTFITPQGHPEAGWVTFSSFKEGGSTTVQIQGLARAGDPVYELAFRIAGSKLQQGIWTHVLQSMLKYMNIEGQVRVTPVCLDSHLQWGRFFNLFLNAQIFSMLYTPALICRKLFNR
ncbi:MAG: STAS domain-containing protein [Dehalococcoidia bacterium]|nr:STAS domain-containing protein [Dehalococcoidia bacterium]